MSIQSYETVTSQPGPSSALYRQRLLLSLVLVHLACGLVVSLILDVPFESGTFAILRTQLKLMIPLFVIVLWFWRFGYMAICVRPKRPIQWFIADIKRILLDGDRIATGVLAFLSVVLIFGTYTFLKDALPLMVPYSWDPTFAEWDRMLHFGQDPWTFLMPIFGAPMVTSALNVVYHFWFFLMYFLVLWACFDIKNIQKSVTFLVAFALCWMLGGNVIATLLSSGGPVYYEVFGFGDTFVPLMDRLYAINDITRVWAIDVQELLLDGYLTDGPVKGISAMPSMHVGSTVIMTMFCFSHKRWLGWMMVVFTGLIMIGSVHLAWHYAIDGYLAVAIALACWGLARALTRRFSPVV